jgi:uncharacterized protein (DUF885 family)
VFVNPELKSLADEYWAGYLEDNPTDAHMMGDYSNIGAVERADRATEDRRIARMRSISERARAIDRMTLSSDDLATVETLVYQVDTKTAVLEMRQAEFGIDPIFGLQASINVTIPQLTLENAEHAAAMHDKYIAFGEVFDEMTERLAEGKTAGRVNARFAVDGVLKQLNDLLESPVDSDPLLTANLPDTMTDDQKSAWLDRTKEIIEGTFRPAVARYRDFIANEISPVARPDEQAGLWALPDGDLLYSRLLERYTTFPMQAAEIHAIGLQQVERLEKEYRQYGPEGLGTDDVNEIFNILRTDKSITHTSGEDIVAVCEEAFERARAEMGNWFGRLPMSDCKVHETKHGAIAYYFEPAEDGSRPGTFFMNTADPSAWGHAEVEGTAFHEGIPGHHMQIAIAQEMGDVLPDFRRGEFISAYGEGWALYTERLSNEMGLYSGPLELVGMLQGDSMRACRLVVDTGMHALGWTRQQGIDYMWNNSPMSMQQIVGEIDRYLSFPGQAVSYMIGRLEIDRIRREAERDLGDRFDIKGFHDTILGSGAVPLGSLDRIVKEWTATV